jgi:tetratricopeptide (TPR) repeat protein
VIVCLIATGVAIRLSAADQWFEVKSAHFTVVSNGSERNTRTLVWQLEQVRGAMAALFAWARVDLNEPLMVIAVKDENSMRAMAPRYWEERGSVHPASVWVSGADQHYLTIRTDLQVEDQTTINPHINAYFSYIGLVMGQSLGHDLPLWLNRGLTGVLSNTIVRNDHLLLGAPIPWELQRLREGTRLPLAKLLTVTRSSVEFKEGSRLEVFDAQAWAFVHFLMFGENGARADKLNQFARLVSAGKDPAASFAETLGSSESLENPFRGYIDRSVYTFRRINIDVSVERERFPVRVMSAAESAAVRAHFHAAMRRPVEARAAIADARKVDPNLPGSYSAEALVLDGERKSDEARAAYAKAAELGSANPYVYYRLAGLAWQPMPNRETLTLVEKHLSQAIQLNNRYAAAYAWLGEIRSALEMGDGLALIRRAISLEPVEGHHHLRAASVLVNRREFDQAIAEAAAAVRLADTDEDRRDAQQLLDSIVKMKASSPR